MPRHWYKARGSAGLAVLSPTAPRSSLVLGALKTVVGHLEADAGIAGMIKCALALQHAQVPPNLHLRQVNPWIELQGHLVAYPTGSVALPQPPQALAASGSEAPTAM